MRRAQILGGLLLAVALLYFTFREAELSHVVGALRQANVGYIVASVLVALGSLFYRGYRWGLLLRPVQRCALSSLVRCTFMGFALSTILPARLGELARPMLLGRREGLSKSSALATVLVERFLDAITLLLLLIVYLLTTSPANARGSDAIRWFDGLTTAGIYGVLVLGVVLGGCFVLALWPTGTSRFLSNLTQRFPERLHARVDELIASFLLGFQGLAKPGLLLLIAVHSIGLWVLICGLYVLLFRSIGIDLPVSASVPVVAVTAIGVMVPVPGAVGSFHKAVQLALTGLFAVDNDAAVAYAVISHAVAFLPVAVVGLMLLAREGISLGSIKRWQNTSSSL